MSATPDAPAPEVLARYPAVFHAARLTPLGNRGGFSGARLWRVEAGSAAFCLRAWPPRQSDPGRLDFVHALQRGARAAGLAFVPAVVAASDGCGHVAHAGRLWDLTQWLPGRADFHDSPSVVRLEAAAAALARVHAAWDDPAAGGTGVCPALRRRLAAAAEWQALRHSGWQPLQGADAADPVRPVAERALVLLDGHVAEVAGRLQPRAERHWPLQPCLCDVWHDHLLFEGDRLTGLVDYGAAKVDHPAVDVARMLGSLVPDDPAAWRVGLGAYRAVRPLGDDEAELARALDETGAVIGVATWLRWLYEEARPFEDRAAVARRLASLVGRIERWGRRVHWTFTPPRAIP
jgi:homoserine kinase type II